MARLMELRGQGISELSGQAGIPEAELRALLAGAPPEEALLRRLAPVLGLREADLLAIAWMDLPEDLAPLDPRASWYLPYLAWHASRLQPEQVGELRELVTRMPQEELPSPAGSPAPTTPPERSPGGMLLRLFGNRNMGRRAAYAIMVVTDRGLSPSTVWMAGHGRKELSAEEFADYISVLDISPADLSIVTGMDLPDPFPRRPPGTAEMARLIWDVRRLTSDQVKRVRDLAEERIRMASLSEAP
jgi:hypothetical protein